MIEGAAPGLISEIWERDEYRVRPHITAGSRVVDIGAHVGTFTLWAVSLGATVIAVEPYPPNVERLVRNTTGRPNVTVWPVAAGSSERMCGTDGQDTGVATIPGGTIRMVTLATIIGGIPVDVLKIDAEGAEYDILIGADLALVDYLTLELHLWTTPDRPVPGWGVRDFPMTVQPQELVDWIEQTHNVEMNGNLLEGGYLYGTRR